MTSGNVLRAGGVVVFGELPLFRDVFFLLGTALYSSSQPSTVAV
jgi:hypothetical protein